ncbi:hypothetical protein T10_6996 [Trichinella papuae]|uniref:Uncharacterized protein n=1 Tax=Trichinella papuae TaxID=268474 RepID=A0A0V1MC37_9BILA|nr:hypothetical protein T10_6996 [Trichinella papuae]
MSTGVKRPVCIWFYCNVYTVIDKDQYNKGFRMDVLLVLKLVFVSSLCAKCVSLYDNAGQVCDASCLKFELHLLFILTSSAFYGRRGEAGFRHASRANDGRVRNCQLQNEAQKLRDYDNEVDEQFYNYRFFY